MDRLSFPKTRRLADEPVTVWFTGLSASGKTTLATALHDELGRCGVASHLLDGDCVRRGLCRDLGYSPAERSENLRRIAEVARLMNDAGLIVIVAAISPYQADRANARTTIGPHRFREVYVSTRLEICEARDPKGLYALARRGSLADFTGISAPYEQPDSPDVVIDTCDVPLAEAVRKLLAVANAAPAPSA